MNTEQAKSDYICVRYKDRYKIEIMSCINDTPSNRIALDRDQATLLIDALNELTQDMPFNEEENEEHDLSTS